MSSAPAGPTGAGASHTAQAPLVAISILNWNGWQDTLECLESVRKLDYPNYLTVVVDNGSTNGSADKIKAWAEQNLGPDGAIADYTQDMALAGGEPGREERLEQADSNGRLVLIRNQENLGFTGGNNVALHYALHRLSPASQVLLLNNDMNPATDSLRHLVSVSQDSGAGIVGACVFIGASGTECSPAPFTSVVRRLFLQLPFVRLPSFYPRRDREFLWACSSHGGAVLLSSRLLRDIYRSRGEYLSSRLFMYMDEHELHYQAKRHGYRAAVALRAFAFHKGGRSSTDNSLRVSYYWERNKILVADEALPAHLRLLFHAVNLPLLALRFTKYLATGRVSLARTILAGQTDGYRKVGGKWGRHDLATAAHCRRTTESQLQPCTTPQGGQPAGMKSS